MHRLAVVTYTRSAWRLIRDLPLCVEAMQRRVVERAMLQSKALLKVATLSQAEVAIFDTLNSVGGKVWPSAEHFVSYFENNSIDLSGKSVLELGSGCGYTGIALAILGAPRVVLTDQLIKQSRLEYDMEGCLVQKDHNAQNKILLDLCQDNINSNKDLLKHSNVTVLELEWGKKNKWMLQALDGDRFDMVVGSDLTYIPEATESLFWTVSQLLQKAKKDKYDCKFLVAHQKRRKSSTAFALACAKQFGLANKVLLEEETFSIWEFKISANCTHADLDSI